ncbi:Uncharacterised protein [Klebsiella pneumoniae]|nr:Uncharacterised protein [Klebsiella pneumoniae]
MNVIDRFLQRPETYGNPFSQNHFHQVLLHGVFRYFVIGNQYQVCPRKSDPLYADLTMTESFVDTAKYDIWRSVFLLVVIRYGVTP